jgi:F-type H+-transporting ATPase subunit a
MEHHVSWLTRVLNQYFGQYVVQLDVALHLKPHDADTPIPEHVVMALVVVLLATALALFLRSRLSVERPRGLQQVAELLITNPLGFGIRDLLEENAGHEGFKFIPVVGSITVFVLLTNLMSLFPLFTAPTAEKTVPLGCALITFFYFNWQGIKHHGPVGYMKHFAGPVWWLAPLIFPVEIISTTARILSLTVRLWANIFASDLIYTLFLTLLLQPVVWAQTKSPILVLVLAIFPAVIPVLFIGLHIFVSLIQGYVFTVLPSIYLGTAIAEEH